MRAFDIHKGGKTRGAINWLNNTEYGCKSYDWCIAATEWLKRRVK